MFHIDKSDPYTILEIHKNSDNKVIREAYLTLAKKYHPDRHSKEQEQENTKKFQQISDAYEQLSNNSYKNGNITTNDMFEDIYGELFTNSKKKKLSIYRELELSLDDIYNGKKLYISYQRQYPKDEICYSCKGTGKTFQNDNNLMELCNLCNGLGKSNELLIQNCNIEIYIEPGFSKKKLWYDQKGHINIYGNSGDLIINILYKPHKIYTHKNNNLYTTFNLNLKETLLGTIKTIKFLDGNCIDIPIDGPIKSGRMLKLNKKGINSTGSLYIKLKINIPEKITDKQKNAIKNFF
jgi:DnaJ-class molecular chaperone